MRYACPLGREGWGVGHLTDRLAPPVEDLGSNSAWPGWLAHGTATASPMVQRSPGGERRTGPWERWAAGGDRDRLPGPEIRDPDSGQWQAAGSRVSDVAGFSAFPRKNDRC